MNWENISKSYSDACNQVEQINNYGQKLISDTNIKDQIQDLESLNALTVDPSLQNLKNQVLATDQQALSGQVTLNNFLNDENATVNRGQEGGPATTDWQFISDAASGNTQQKYSMYDDDYKAYYTWQSGTDPHTDDNGWGLTYDWGSSYKASRAKDQEWVWGWADASQLASTGHIVFNPDPNATQDLHTISNLISGTCV